LNNPAIFPTDYQERADKPTIIAGPTAFVARSVNQLAFGPIRPTMDAAKADFAAIEQIFLRCKPHQHQTQGTLSNA